MNATKQLAAALGEESLRIWKIGPGGIVIDINSSDPDTPAMVWDSVRKKKSSTYDCACSEGSIDDEIELTGPQLDWLNSFTDDVAKAFNIARRGMPQYQ